MPKLNILNTRTPIIMHPMGFGRFCVLWRYFLGNLFFPCIPSATHDGDGVYVLFRDSAKKVTVCVWKFSERTISVGVISGGSGSWNGGVDDRTDSDAVAPPTEKKNQHVHWFRRNKQERCDVCDDWLECIVEPGPRPAHPLQAGIPDANEEARGNRNDRSIAVITITR